MSGDGVPDFILAWDGIRCGARVVNGRPALVLDDIGPTCGPSGREPCGTILYWNGTEFRAGSEAR